MRKESIGTSELYLADCMDVLPTLNADSVDSIVTDPPYGLGFMGKLWDHGVPSAAVWVEALRVLKPGGHLLAFSGSRTYHRMTTAIEDAGFEIRDQIMWLYGSGFPKSMNVSKAIDKAAGAEREVVGRMPVGWGGLHNNKNLNDDSWEKIGTEYPEGQPITAPATEAAKQWDGWGTALKPAHEPIVVARKPFKGTVAANVLEHGTGAINVDACRIAGAKPETTRGAGGQNGRYGPINSQGRIPDDGRGRWPANVIHDGSEEVLEQFARAGEAGAQGKVTVRNADKFRNAYGAFGGSTEDAPFYGDTGTAARFFYCAKASQDDREDGNTHPTVKPTDLMRYLCRLVTPEDGTVLDMFMGSGSTGKAATAEGFKFIGFERESEYFEIACKRIRGADNRWSLPLFS